MKITKRYLQLYGRQRGNFKVLGNIEKKLKPVGVKGQN
jgi:hypothetical protein